MKCSLSLSRYVWMWMWNVFVHEWMNERMYDVDADGVFHDRFFPTLARFSQIFMLYINLENYLAHQNKKCDAWCFYIHLAYCSNNNNNNKKNEGTDTIFFDSIAYEKKRASERVCVCEWVSLCVLKYLPDKCWLFLFCYQKNTKKKARSWSSSRRRIYNTCLYAGAVHWNMVKESLSRLKSWRRKHTEQQRIRERMRCVITRFLNRKSTVLVSLTLRFSPTIVRIRWFTFVKVNKKKWTKKSVERVLLTHFSGGDEEKHPFRLFVVIVIVVIVIGTKTITIIVIVVTVVFSIIDDVVLVAVAVVVIVVVVAEHSTDFSFLLLICRASTSVLLPNALGYSLKWFWIHILYFLY